MPIIVYKKLSESEMRSIADKAIEQITQWFKDNPRRRVCNVGVWYDKVLKIKRKNIADQVNAALDEEIGNA